MLISRKLILHEKDKAHSAIPVMFVYYCSIVLFFFFYPDLALKTGLSVTINITRQLLIKSILLCKFNFGSFAVREPRCDNEDMQCVPTSCNDSQDDPVVSQVKTLIISS